MTRMTGGCGGVRSVEGVSLYGDVGELLRFGIEARLSVSGFRYFFFKFFFT